MSAQLGESHAPHSFAMGSCLNQTGATEGLEGAGAVLVGVVLAALIVVTICGNIIVCLVVTLDRRLRSLTNCLIVSLATTDLLLGLLVLPFSAIYELTKNWPFGTVLCNIYTSLDVMLCTASILNLLMISLDRYYAVTKPLRYTQLITSRRVALALVVIWAVALMVSFLPIHLGWNASRLSTNSSAVCQLQVNTLYGLVDSLLTFYFPLTVMCITYYRIFKIAREQAKRINHASGCTAPGPSLVKEHKATVTLAVVLGAFIICWFPYFTVFIYRGMTDDGVVDCVSKSIVLWLGYANSALNPILYAALNRDFRSAYQRLLRCRRQSGLSHCQPLTSAYAPRRRGRRALSVQQDKPLRLQVRNGRESALARGAMEREGGRVLPEKQTWQRTRHLPAQGEQMPGMLAVTAAGAALTELWSLSLSLSRPPAIGLQPPVPKSSKGKRTT